MTIRTRMAVATLTVACSASLIGCGTPRVEPGSTPSAAALVLPTPAASDFVSTVMRTRVLGTAELTVDVTTTTPDGTTRLTGSGPAGISQGYGGLTWVTDDGETFTEISNGKGLFVQTLGSDGMWTKWPDKESTPTGRLADPLRGLGTAMSVVREGTERLDDATVVRYTARTPAGPDSLSLMGLTDDQVAALGDSWEGEWIDLTILVDSRGRIVQVERSVDLPDAPGGPVSASTMTTLEDFSRTIDLEPPPTESVTEASSSA